MANTAIKKVQNLDAKVPSENGAVRVHESVVSSIVRKTVLGIEGVVRFAGNSFVDNIAEFVGSKAMQDRAISVEMGKGSVSIEIQVILQYGIYIPDVACNIQEAVRTQVQDLTGIPVESVSVFVMDIEMVESEESEEESNS